MALFGLKGFLFFLSTKMMEKCLGFCIEFSLQKKAVWKLLFILIEFTAKIGAFLHRKSSTSFNFPTQEGKIEWEKAVT